MQNLKIMKNKFLLWFWILFPLLAFSQGENDNWYFGGQANINFAGTTPTVVNNSVMNAPAACGSISDSQGNLLFYTNGMTIWDRDHNVMLNGSGLTGTVNSAQLLIMPDLVNSDRYYVFTTADSYNNLSYTAYSIVDMTLGSLGSNGQPLGGVDSTKKNIPILDDAGNLITTGAVSVMPHANGSDFWILIPSRGKVLSFLFDSWGLSTIPGVSLIVANSSIKHFSIKVSPKINYLVLIDHWVAVTFGSSEGVQVSVTPFDSNTGKRVVGGFNFALTNFNRHEIEFNEDGTILYSAANVNGNYKLHQWDLINYSNPSLPHNMIYSTPTKGYYGQIQRNHKGEIYFTLGNGPEDNNQYLGQILNPNVLNGTIVNPNSVFLNGKKPYKGLPQLVLPYEILPPPACENDIHLTSIENNTNYTFRASNSIIMDTNYILNGKNIVMKAGDNILMSPNTHINSGSEYLARIEECPFSKTAQRNNSSDINQQNYTIESENQKNAQESIYIFPNPTYSQFTIDIENNNLDKWELFDLSGKLVLKGNTTISSVESLSQGTYILKVHLKDNKVSTIKLIKK